MANISGRRIERRQPTLSESRKRRRGKRNTARHVEPRIAEIAREAQRVLTVWLEDSGAQLDEYAAHRIRLCVVRAIFWRLARLGGLVTAEYPGVELPDDADLHSVFRATIDAIDCTTDLALQLGHALEALNGGARGAYFTPRPLAARIVRRTLEPIFCIIPPERTLEMRVCDPAVGGGVFLLELVTQLADRLVDCGRIGDIWVARRLAAIHCAYGVDVDAVSVECTKLALSLECRATNMPRSWLDDNIKHGDALVGLSPEQIRAFSWKSCAQATLGSGAIATELERATGEAVAARKTRMRELTLAAETLP